MDGASGVLGKERSLLADFEAAARRRLSLLLLAADATVISSSPNAEAILAAADGLSLVNGRLRAATTQDDATLRRAVASMDCPAFPASPLTSARSSTSSRSSCRRT